MILPNQGVGVNAQDIMPGYQKDIAMTEIRVLYDGRPLLQDPLGPAACHLYEILTGLPPLVRPVLLLPGDPPGWLPPQIEVQRGPQTNGLQWEQRLVPRIARRLEMDLVHLVGESAPLFTDLPVLVSPAGWGRPMRPAGLRERLRSSAARGGLARARGVLWPDLLPPLSDYAQTVGVPLRVHPDFVAGGFIFSPEIPGVEELPGSFILYHGPFDEESLRLTMEAWTWAAGPVGDVHPLLLLGVPQERHALVAALVRRHHLGETVVVLPPIGLPHLPAIYRGAYAVFQPGEASPWAGPLTWGMSCGLPVVGHERPLAAAIAGNGAYLVDPQDTRGLGAALIAVVVKEPLRKELGDAARERARSWREKPIGQDLADLYHELLTSNRD